MDIGFGNYVCCIGFSIFGFIFMCFGAYRKITSRKSNYTEFELNEYNHPMTWKDRGEY